MKNYLKVFIAAMLSICGAMTASGSVNGNVYTNEPATAFWAMNATDNLNATVTPEGVFSLVAFDYGDMQITGMGGCTMKNGSDAGVKLIKFKPAGSTKSIEWSIKPTKGLTFTPTHISGYVNRYGTDAENCVTITMIKEDGTSVDIGTWTALRQGNPNSKDYDVNGIHMFDVELTASQQAQLMTNGTLKIIGKVGVGSTKELGYGQVKVEGTVSGTLETVARYSLNVQNAPAEGGNITKTPNATEYDVDTDVTLVATPNFGYHFTNWTLSDGTVAGTDTKLIHKVKKNETVTANYTKVNTYALNVALEGDAIKHMVVLSPAPTIINGKNMYEEGQKVTATALNNDILTFSNWNTGETSSSIDIFMNSDVDITATYSAIDYIVGWDFYEPGGNSRVADFFSTNDNDVTTMVMIDATGKEKGFYLRPYNNSYEGKTCALNWNALAEKYFYQTKINAQDFMNIRVKSQMMYNYNAYTVQRLEASLDGQSWELITSQDLGGTKNWQSVDGTLPSKYDHAKTLYLRWIPDYSSEIKGSTSNNDGTCLTNVFVIADKELTNDGIAPILVSSVPAEGATNASANGKIILNFDEKVKVAEGTTATLGDKTLQPVVSGKTVTFDYKGLEYSTAYTFTLAAGAVGDLTDNYMTEPITINFQTRTKPVVQKRLFDEVVSNGTELAAAIKNAASRTNKSERYRIFVKSGDLVMPFNGSKVTGGDGKSYDDPITYISASKLSIIGEDYNNTSITNVTPPATWDNGFGIASPLEGIGKSDVFNNSGSDNYFQGITIKSSLADKTGRGIAFEDLGNRTIFKNARLWGYQDTYVSNGSNRYYFETSAIRGCTDFICGKGDAWFEQVDFIITGGYLAVPSQPRQYGYILNKCNIKGDKSNTSYTLGRPWGSGTPIAIYLNCTMDPVPKSIGWDEMTGGWPKRFAEYNSMTKSGSVIDLSNRKTDFGGKVGCNNPVLTAEEAASYSIEKVMGATDKWDPQAFTEQASAPQNVVLDTEKSILGWEDSNYVLCWAVFQDGEFLGFTIDNQYPVVNTSATYTVRAANEMGGLSEATTAVAGSFDGISSINADTNTAKKDTNIYNIAGQRVSNNAKGIVLVGGKKVVIK